MVKFGNQLVGTFLDAVLFSVLLVEQLLGSQQPRRRQGLVHWILFQIFCFTDKPRNISLSPFGVGPWRCLTPKLLQDTQFDRILAGPHQLWNLGEIFQRNARFSKCESEKHFGRIDAIRWH
uniref:Secreted protein n=1 Tax=Eutreptiella gymnastica TaxID=73025 RepID=A0A7S4LEM0_9EUGL